jgi:hypothetical protein
MLPGRSREGIKAFLPPEFIEHRRKARKEMLLAWRSVIDSAIKRIDEKDNEHSPGPGPHAAPEAHPMGRGDRLSVECCGTIARRNFFQPRVVSRKSAEGHAPGPETRSTAG